MEIGWEEEEEAKSVLVKTIRKYKRYQVMERLYI